jgi:hypothetical protein
MGPACTRSAPSLELFSERRRATSEFREAGNTPSAPIPISSAICDLRSGPLQISWRTTVRYDPTEDTRHASGAARAARTRRQRNGMGKGGPCENFLYGFKAAHGAARAAASAS